MFKKKPVFWALLIGILVLLNLWRWLPVWFHGGESRQRESNAGWKLDFPAPLEEGESNLRRNLFAIGPMEATRKIRPRLVVMPTPTPMLSSPDGSVMEVAGGYRLMGVLSHGGKSMALIGKGGQSFQVGMGDEIEGLYQVQTITDNEVYLAEKSTGNNLKLHIWDSQGAKQ